jgi:nucleoside-diphosphate-sugar epimerase
LPLATWGVDIKSRQVTFYNGGTNKFDTTNLDTVGKAVANILDSPNGFENRSVFISDYQVSQRDIFNAITKATGSQANDWKIEERTAESLRQEGYEKIAGQDFGGVLDLISAALYEEGKGSLFSATHVIENEKLGLEQEKETLDAATARVLAEL